MTSAGNEAERGAQSATDRLGVEVGGVELSNPIICGSGEHLITPGGIRAALASGAGAVMLKSANENEGARRQLAHTDYALYDSKWNHLDWGDQRPDASLLNRSGLFPGQLDTWIEMATMLVAEEGDSVIVPSVIPGDFDRAVELSRDVVAASGCRALEVNVGAPHGREAPEGAIALETRAGRVAEQVAAIREVVDASLWIKLTGQSDDVTSLAEGAFSGGADAVTIMGRFMAFLPDVETQQPALGTMGAFGGGWALPITCRWLALARAEVGSERSLVATNGARDGLDVVRFVLAGARAVQMNTAIFTGGFDVVTRALRDIEVYLEQRNQRLRELVGRAADQLVGYTDQPADSERWHQFVPDRSKPESNAPDRQE